MTTYTISNLVPTGNDPSEIGTDFDDCTITGTVDLVIDDREPMNVMLRGALSVESIGEEVRLIVEGILASESDDTDALPEVDPEVDTIMDTPIEL